MITSLRGVLYFAVMAGLIVAVGQITQLAFLPEDIEVAPNNTIAVDPVTMATS